MKIILDGQKVSVEEVLSCLIEFEVKNESAILMGNKAALSKIKPTAIEKTEKTQFFRDGYLASFNGYECIPIPITYELTPFYSIFGITDLLITTKEVGYEIARHFSESVKLKPCPFCDGNISIGISDDEGNPRDEEYEDDP